MPREDEIEVFGVVDGVEDGEDGTAWVAEDVFDSMPEHHLVENLTAGHPDEGGVEELGMLRLSGDRVMDIVSRRPLLELGRRPSSPAQELELLESDGVRCLIGKFAHTLGAAVAAFWVEDWLSWRARILALASTMESGKVDLHLDHCTGGVLGAEDCLKVRATLCIVAFFFAIINERLEGLRKEGEGGKARV